MSPPMESAPGKRPVTATASLISGSEPAGNPTPRRELLRMLLSVLNDPERAYTAYEDIMAAAGENVIAQIGSRVDVLGARVDALSARVDALAERLNAQSDAFNARMDALAESMKAQWRLLWGVLGLQTALVVAIITLLFRA